MQKFLENLSSKFLAAINRVLMFNPKKKPSQVKIEINDALHKVEEEWVLPLFKQAWNSIVPRLLHIDGDCTMEEWVWVIPHLVVACRKALHGVVRSQFEDDQEDDVEYVPDSFDLAKAYYCVGVVWRPLLKFFSGRSRVTDVIRSLFVTEKQAVIEGLPTQEVDNK